MAIKDIMTGRQSWLHKIWDQEHIGPSHHPLETSALMCLNELVQKVWTDIMKMGSPQQTEGSSQMMTIRHSPRRFVRLGDKGNEGNPQGAVERKVMTEKGAKLE